METKEKIFFEEFESLYYFHGSSQNWGMQDFHVHDQHEILLFLSSGSTLEVGNRRYVAKAGDMFLLNSKEYHRTKGAAGKPYERYVLQFEPELFREISKAFGYNFAMYFEGRPADFIHKIHLSEANLARVEQLFAKIERNIINESKDNNIMVKLKLSILELLVTINELYEFLIKEKANSADGFENDDAFQVEAGKTKNLITQRGLIEQIKRYVKENREEKLGLNEIAQKFFMSPYYLSHYFKKETGFTLAQYIANQKIIAAKSLLKKGYSVAEVALKLSYSSDSHFISVFKRNCGITPKQYAKKQDDSNQ
ncbi:MAG: AraC family transcriptional regulator [Defluviitaleaceae bacterium]|nr:AraC family transcriptional regulator [Defluviitaleaceae bacterium]